MSQEISAPRFDEVIPVDPDKNTRALFVHVDGGLFVPGSMVESFKQADSVYTTDRREYFSRAAGYLSAVKESGLSIAFVHSSEDAASKRLCIVMSPLNDGVPESNPDAITHFVEAGTKSEAQAAKPNSHRPLSKLIGDYQLGQAEGLAIPRLQIFAREVPYMTSEQKRRVASGDMLPYGEITLPAIKQSQDKMHEVYGTEPFEEIDIFASGLGAKGLGVAAYILRRAPEYKVGRVTLVNFSLTEQLMTTRGIDYSLRKTAGEASKLILPKNDYVRVSEFSVLRELDRHTERSMHFRQIRAMLNIKILKSLLDAKQGTNYIEDIMSHGGTVTIANSINNPRVADTRRYLPVGDGLLRLIDIVGVDGKKVGESIGEHGVALAAINNISLAS